MALQDMHYQKIKDVEKTLINKIEKNKGNYLLHTKDNSITSKKIVIATNGFYQEGLYIN